ncbi:MAG TPA: aminotransferase class III-fold pyridoxal phosphate-dependent enzyme [Nitrospirota bacterium]|nr:aminotransferase class III-fold pyridoxal phosphate-dependent enzyme [Nitrospirota bacterium]
MKTGVVVQARNSSTRYPGKMLHNFHGKSALEWVLDRCAGIETDYKLLATSADKDDDILADIAKDKDWRVVRGSVEDVLGRFAKAVKDFELDAVIRITGDCLLTDYRLVNHALSRFRKLRCDYLVLTDIIDGFDVEVISSTAIISADKGAKLPSEREHVTPFIKKSKCFKAVSLPYGEENLSHIHLSLDYKDDAEVIGRILRKFENTDFSYEDVASLLKTEPQITEITGHITPNTGYQKSLNVDREFIRRLKGRPLRLKSNMKLFNRVKSVIPNCSQTFSKSYLQFSAGASPLFVKEGKGCYLTDVDNNKFIDHAMGLGACILGYAFEPVMREIKKQIKRGSVYTLPHYLECELAELLTQVVPCAEMVRFGKNGSDVTSAAVRLARAYTGRDYVACCGYHGWQDWYIATTTRNNGIPDDIKRLTLTFRYNDTESLERLFELHKDKIACVIMEPVSLQPPDEDYLRKVKEITHRNGALLVFDEVVTGFRFSIGGAQKYFGVIPDIACIGKAIANGMPVSAIVGRKEVMRLFDEIFFSFTFGGETLSIASALATIRYMDDNRVIEYLWQQGDRLKAGIDKIIKEKELEDVLSIDGYPVRTVLIFKGDEKEGLKMKTLFQQECAKRGVLFSGGHNISLPHGDDIISKTISVYDEVMDILRYSLEYNMIDEMIDGRLLEPVFRKV